MEPVSVEVTTYYLEMIAPSYRKVPAPRDGLAVRKIHSPSAQYYRAIYDVVGNDYNWRLRRKMSPEELLSIINHPLNDLHVIHVDGEAAGLAEFDRRQPNEIELVQFGLMPAYFGQGIGKWFLQQTIDIAWAYQPQRLWVHTCTLDHKAALPNYLQAGFKIYKEEICQRVLG